MDGWQCNLFIQIKIGIAKQKLHKQQVIWNFNINILFADFGPIEIPPAPESVASYEVNGPRLMISKIVNENFKSYAGVQTLGPFHKVWGLIDLLAEFM